jgi:nitrogen-specific signal transduction histidine kinase
VDYPDGNLPQIRQLGHELRNALTSVLTAAEILKRRCGEPAETEYEVITRQVYRMRKLVDEMLVLTLTGRSANGTDDATTGTNGTGEAKATNDGV